MSPESIAVGSPQLVLRPISDADLPFLEELYGSTRAEELAMVPDWSDEQKREFVHQQFVAQHAYYRENYLGAQFLVVECEGQPAGRLYVDRWPDQIRLMDIAFLPVHRGRGFGGRLLAELIEEARAAQKPLTIHVERFNRALSLYDRLGFRLIEDRGVYLLLGWVPEGVTFETLAG